MEQMNLISAYQSIQAYETLCFKDKGLKKNFNLKEHESRCLLKLIEILKNYNANFECFNGYYIGYLINQINKEFDLLRFSDDCIINIELKSCLSDDVKLQKIQEQLSKNYYYLKFLSKNLFLFTYVEDDGIYAYNQNDDSIQKVDASVLINTLVSQKVNYYINPDDLFIPSNYLISPFNNTEKFLDDEYFLTSHQDFIEKEIIKAIISNEHKIFCISANSGTGKTLLIYDIAKKLIKNGKNPLIIHCGKLNLGHEKLKCNEWNIIPISSIRKDSSTTFYMCGINIIILDEAQRIYKEQLDIIIDKFLELKISVIFSYDIKQYLKQGEGKDIYEYIKDKKLNVHKYELKNKIRTNKEIASFIKNLIHIGESKYDVDYKKISIEYFEDIEEVHSYIEFLQKVEKWKAITFTNSKFSIEPIDSIADICGTNAHDVIGQEFKKVVLVMDSNFQYNECGTLMVNECNYYSVKGMLYQIVTRAVDELKIVVLNNPKLFFNLLTIKQLVFLKDKEN